MITQILLNLNAIICAITSIRLMTYIRGASRHNKTMAFIAWLMTVATGAVTIEILTGEYTDPDWTEVMINLLLCVAVLRAHGNVAKIIRG